MAVRVWPACMVPWISGGVTETGTAVTTAVGVVVAVLEAPFWVAVSRTSIVSPASARPTM